MDDIDLLSQNLIDKTHLKSANDSLIALADHDNDDLVIIHTKRMLVEEKLRQENRQLFENNRRLEQQKDEIKAKFDLLDLKSNEYINKVKNEMQVRISSNSARDVRDQNFLVPVPVKFKFSVPDPIKF